MKYVEFNKQLVNLEKVERIYVQTYGYHDAALVIHFSTYATEGEKDYTDKQYPTIKEAEKAYNKLRRIITEYQNSKRLPKI